MQEKKTIKLKEKEAFKLRELENKIKKHNSAIVECITQIKMLDKVLIKLTDERGEYLNDWKGYVEKIAKHYNIKDSKFIFRHNTGSLEIN